MMTFKYSWWISESFLRIQDGFPSGFQSFNPIALRTAKLHRVLAVLSAIGLRTLDAINIVIC